MAPSLCLCCVNECYSINECYSVNECYSREIVNVDKWFCVALAADKGAEVPHMMNEKEVPISSALAP